MNKELPPDFKKNSDLKHRALILTGFLGVMGVALFTIVACDTRTPEKIAEDNKPVLVVEHEGIKVWSIEVPRHLSNEKLYFTTKSVGEVSWSRNCGKNCERPMRVNGAIE